MSQEAQNVEAVAKQIKKELKVVKNWSLDTRLKWLKKLDKWLVTNKDLVLETIAREKKVDEHGILLNEYMVTRFICKYYIRNAKEILADENRSRPFSVNWGNKKVVVRKEPLGVAGVISPHNHPLTLPMGAVIEALVAGNGVVLKTASDTPRTGDLIALAVKNTLSRFNADKIFERVKGRVGHEIVVCPTVDKIHFTGSTEVGWQIAQKNAKVRLTPPTLELGGSNPAIVLEDADLKKAARVIVWARFASLSCNSIKRVFATAPVYEELCREIEICVKQLKDHEIVSVPDKEVDNYTKFFEDYLDHCGKGMAGGKSEFLQRGHWRLCEPVVLRVKNPTENLMVLKEETFVPILPIVKVSCEAEAVEWANKTRYGLGASVFTRDKKRFERIREKLECGAVSCNDAMTEFAQIQAPFGGWKQSGYGSSHASEGLLEFVKPKAVITERYPAPKLQLYPWTKMKMKWLRRFANWIVDLS